MNRLRRMFAALRRDGRTALIPFIVGGDPDFATTELLLTTLADAGADVIEVGVPFSDPLADGPVIQRAVQRALAHGATPERLLATIARVSPRLRVPIVLLSYWNPIVQFGRRDRGAALRADAFLDAAAKAGVVGIIVPDLPIDEGREFRAAAKRRAIAAIFLATVTTPPVRLRAIAQASEGFIYFVSVTGITGVRRQLSGEWLEGVRQLKRVTTKPICVGFGISTPAQAREVAKAADGVIVGSALVKAIEPSIGRGRAAVAKQAAAFVRRLRKVV